ncbi:MAG: tRNA (adenosine(37)-N6)-threonylcarbamoyltransferase complex dimerization subunit type 1 TsaB [Coleofasciculaceae cyanobacterium]
MMPSLKANQYGFALHTTSSQLGLSISNFGGDTRFSTWDLGRDLSSQLHQYMAEFIAPQTWSDLSFIAVAKGPGSFTSTRIGIVTARTMAQQLDIPLFAISSFAAVAWSYLSDQEGDEKTVVALQMPAQRGQLFTAIYQLPVKALTQLSPDAVMTPETWQQRLDALKMPYQLIDVPVANGDSVSSLLELAKLDWQLEKRPHWSEALPFYGQHPVEK